jgi:hypothetical protein
MYFGSCKDILNTIKEYYNSETDSTNEEEQEHTADE